MNILVVSAASFEAAPTIAKLNEMSLAADGFELGIGALNAAKSAPKCLDVARGRDVLFVGTCGIYGDFGGVQLHTVKTVHWLPTAERLGLAYTVKDTAAPIDLADHHDQKFAAIPQCEAVCTPAISTDGSFDFEKFAIGRPAVENLELYSVAAELKSVSRSFTAFLTITNAVGADAHQQWRDHFRAAATHTAAAIATHMQ